MDCTIENFDLFIHNILVINKNIYYFNNIFFFGNA